MTKMADSDNSARILRKPLSRRRTLALAGAAGLFTLTALSLTGCAGAPANPQPVLDLPKDSPASPDTEASESLKLLQSQAWWRVFGDPLLNELVEAALLRNTDLRAAAERLAAARARAVAAGADLWPEVQAGSTIGTRSMTSAENVVHHYGSRQMDAYALQGTLSWEADLWGKLDALRAGAVLEAEAEAHARDALALTLAAEVADAYFEMRALELQIRTAHQMIESYERTCRIWRVRVEAGHSPETALRRFQAEAAKTRADKLELERRLLAVRSDLCVLSGATPAELTARLAKPAPASRTLDVLAPAPQTPEAVPADLLMRRPDVAEAYARMASRSQAAYAAQMARRPDFSIRADAGLSTIEASNLFKSESGTRSIYIDVLGPIFDAGRRKASAEAASAEARAAEHAFEGCVVNAYREVMLALDANQRSRLVFDERYEAMRRLMRTNDIFEKQYDAGIASVTDLLDVSRQLLTARQSCAEARRQELSAITALCRALGGGWQGTDASLCIKTQKRPQ